jgi:hypothetical protein
VKPVAPQIEGQQRFVSVLPDILHHASLELDELTQREKIAREQERHGFPGNAGIICQGNYETTQDNSGAGYSGCGAQPIPREGNGGCRDQECRAGGEQGKIAVAHEPRGHDPGCEASRESRKRHLSQAFKHGFCRCGRTGADQPRRSRTTDSK